MRSNTKLLSECDCKIISLLAEGHNYASISNNLGISEITVEDQIRLMMNEMGFTSPFQLITWAYQDAIIV
jgi:DNA-binding NarL/FixJ family response regulator